MIHIEASNADVLFGTAVRKLFTEGKECQRGLQNMLEFDATAALVLTDPTRAMVTNPRRNLNPWVTLAEFPWLVVGRNDIAWLRHYLPRAGDFSDDGETWRAGYGPRMRKWYAPGRAKSEADQLRYVIDELKNPHLGGASRRGVISLWDPRSDHQQDSADYPCTNWLSFQARPWGTLDLTVGMRSNDVWWGWSGVNMMNFTLLQQAVAQWTGFEPGRYTHVADNFHLYYDRHGDVARAVYENSYDSPHYAIPKPDFSSELRVFEGSANSAMSRIMYDRDDAEARHEPIYNDIPYTKHHTPWVAEWAYFMGLHPLRNNPTRLAHNIGRLEHTHPDWCAVATNWAERHEEAHA
jgi:thymidylate synthase